MSKSRMNAMSKQFAAMQDALTAGRELYSEAIASLVKLERENERLRAENERLRKQLPAMMQNCTILFRECEKGHGRLTATNWVDHGCPTCERDALRSENAHLRSRLTAFVDEHDGEVDPYCCGQLVDEIKAILEAKEQP